MHQSSRTFSACRANSAPFRWSVPHLLGASRLQTPPGREITLQLCVCIWLISPSVTPSVARTTPPPCGTWQGFLLFRSRTTHVCVSSFPYPPPSVALSPPRSVPVVSGASDPIRRLFSLCAPYPERVAMGAPLHPSLQRLPQVTPHQQGVSALSPHPHRYLQSSLTFPGHTCRDVGPGIRLAVPLGQRVQAAAATSPREGRPAPASPFQHGESPAEVALT